MRGTLLVLTLSIVGACGSDTDYLGESPQDAADDLAQSGCDSSYDCGVIEIDCGTPNVATRVPADQYYDSRADCETTLSDAYFDLFTGCAAANLTDAERDTLNECLNSGGSCPSDSDLQALADAVCSDQPPPNLSDSCVHAMSIISRCSACADGTC